MRGINYHKYQLLLQIHKLQNHVHLNIGMNYECLQFEAYQANSYSATSISSAGLFTIEEQLGQRYRVHLGRRRRSR